MFGLFKKQEQPHAPAMSVEQQIHEAIYSAQDLLITEANRILNEAVPYDEKRHSILKGLSELGFSSAEQVSEFNKIESERKRQAEMKELIASYQQKYPFNKFINRESVTAICEKYNLYLTEARDYISDIPEKNQEEIVNFKFYDTDFREPTEMSRGILSLRFYSGYLISDYGEKLEPRLQVGKDLLIVAPEHKIDMRNKTKIGRILTQDDPIVLQPVKGGYLIVSSWGLEASDELVVNQKLN